MGILANRFLLKLLNISSGYMSIMLTNYTLQKHVYWFGFKTLHHHQTNRFTTVFFKSPDYNEKVKVYHIHFFLTILIIIW